MLEDGCQARDKIITIEVVVKNCLPLKAAADDVVQRARGVYASLSRHADSLPYDWRFTIFIHTSPPPVVPHNRSYVNVFSDSWVLGASPGSSPKTKPFNLTIDQADKAWAWVRKEMKLEKDTQYVLHSLRHACATRLVNRGVDLYVVKEWLGHSSIQVTERYAHLAPSKLAHAASILENYHGSLTQD